MRKRMSRSSGAWQHDEVLQCAKFVDGAIKIGERWSDESMNFMRLSEAGTLTNKSSKFILEQRRGEPG